MKILVTGAAGFIGAHVCRALASRGDDVVGIDNFNSYYDPQLKLDRVIALCPSVRISRVDICDRERVNEYFAAVKPDRVVHLAAQAGVRYSIENPSAYIETNLVGFGNVIEACRQGNVAHLVYASSSSVYGGNEKLPFSESDNVDRPLSLYAATKKANELIAHSYSHLFGFATTGLRFFTVYGPWGRPDMALFKFTKAILDGEPIDLFNGGKHFRDFTYIEDTVAGVLRALDKPNGCQVYNVANARPIALLEFIGLIEGALGIKAKKNLLPMQAGDVEGTQADMRLFTLAMDWWMPDTPAEIGVRRFVDWYVDRYVRKAAA